jgi:hypothetical protein
VDAKGKRKWVYAQKPKGKIYNVRTWVSWGFFALFFTLPFISYHGRPLFLFNIPEAEFIIFGKIFWPQDFFHFWSDDANLLLFSLYCLQLHLAGCSADGFVPKPFLWKCYSGRLNT